MGYRNLYLGPAEIVFGVLQLVFVAAIIVGVVYLIRRSTGAAGTRTSALSILEERYARGEIDRDEFLERRAILSGEPTGKS